MNPVLRKLSGPPHSLAHVADVLEKHIGDGTDEARCKEALDALRAIRKHNASFYMRAALRNVDGAGNACALAREVVTTIRKWHHFSGA